MSVCVYYFFKKRINRLLIVSYYCMPYTYFSNFFLFTLFYNNDDPMIVYIDRPTSCNLL